MHFRNATKDTDYPHIFVTRTPNGHTTVSVEPPELGFDTKTFCDFEEAYDYADLISAEISYYVVNAPPISGDVSEVTIGTTYSFDK